MAAANLRLSALQLQMLCATSQGRAACLQYREPLNQAMADNRIDTPQRVAMFLAQIAHESQDFTRVSENLNYSDPRSIAQLFRSGFDLDGDGVVDPEEIEFAKGYVRAPEKLANRAYAHRYGNGDEASGDGWRYRGAGLKQLTFKANHADFGLAMGIALDRVPAYLRTPEGAAKSAAWFWRTRELNKLADKGLFEDITRKINGALTGQPARLAYLERARRAVG